MKLDIVIIFLLSVLVSVYSAPAANPSSTKDKNENSPYDLSEFSEVYNQRQNGTENYRINIDGVVVVLTPPGSLLQAASLLDPALFDNGEEDYSDLEDLFKPPPLPSSTSKPEQSTNASTEASTENSPTDKTQTKNNVVIEKRKLKVPGFIRPFIRTAQNREESSKQIPISNN